MDRFIGEDVEDGHKNISHIAEILEQACDVYFQNRVYLPPDIDKKVEKFLVDVPDYIVFPEKRKEYLADIIATMQQFSARQSAR